MKPSLPGSVKYGTCLISTSGTVSFGGVLEWWSNLLEAISMGITMITVTDLGEVLFPQKHLMYIEHI
jgi:hypothetical protein